MDAYTAPGVLPEGVLLTCSTGVYGHSVSKHLFAMLLALMKRLPQYRDQQRQAQWRDLGQARSLLDAEVLMVGTGDLGTSFAYSQPVSMLIGERFGNSLLLSGTSAVLAVILGCWLGLYAGKNHGGLLDRIFSGMAYLFNSMPTFWLGMMGILLFASTLRWLPTQGMYNLRAGYTGMAYVGDVMVHMILPCASLVAVQIPAYFRITKTSVMQVMADDYIMTFRVTGMSERKIFRKYILKNAILPVLTVFGINLAYVVSGSTLTEIVFSWPGIGSLMYRSIMMRDYNVLMGVYLILALTVAAMMIIVDLVYAWLDPRIRYT